MARALFYALLAWPIGGAMAADPRQTQMAGAHFVGAAGCKSSSCHGGAGEKRSQYITWLRQDVHTRGYAILTNARSERIAEALDLLPSAKSFTRAATSARCTACHSPFQAIPQARRLSAADPNESVSCESCHGAAEPWLRGHTRPDWTYATRVGAGMRDLKSFYVRANTCVACHQNLDSDIAAAGHPELVFELESQSRAQPKHWRDPEGSSVRTWLVGQAVALREASWRLAQNPTASEQSIAQWNALAWLLSKVTSADRTLPPIESPEAPTDYARIQQQADALARRAAQQNFSSDFANRILRELAASDSEFVEARGTTRDLSFRRAQRLFLAIKVLAAKDQTLAEAIGALESELQSPEAFDPTRFGAHLAKLRFPLQ